MMKEDGWLVVYIGTVKSNPCITPLHSDEGGWMAGCLLDTVKSNPSITGTPWIMKEDWCLVVCLGTMKSSPSITPLQRWRRRMDGCLFTWKLWRVIPPLLHRWCRRTEDWLFTWKLWRVISPLLHRWWRKMDGWLFTWKLWREALHVFNLMSKEDGWLATPENFGE